MASWCYTEIGISVTDDDLELKQQYLDCLGLLKIDGDVFNETECDAAGYELYDSLLNTVCFQVTMIFGKHSDDYSIPENLHDIFSLVNLLFPHTYLYCQHYSGTSVTTENDDDFGELQVTCDVSLREEIISFFIEDFTKRWNEALQRIQEKTEDHSIPDGTGLPFDISFTDYGFLIVMNSLFNTVVSLEEQFFENPSSDDTIRQALSNLKAHYSNLEYEGYLFFDDGGVL